MSSPLPFATELVNLVIDQLCDSPADLKACALTSRDWVSQSRLHLFNHIHLYQNNVDPFLTLCASPYSTLPLARIRSLCIATNLMVDGESEDKKLQNCPAFDQLLTWQSSDGKSVANTVFRNLQRLELDWIGWHTLSKAARLILYSGFQNVTELKMWNTVFESGDEYLEFVTSLIALEQLWLDGVVIRAPIQGLRSLNLPVSLHTLSIQNICSRLAPVIRIMTPCPTLKNFSGHVCNFQDMTVDCAEAVGALLASTGPCLEEFAFRVQAAGMLKEGMDLDASLQYIDLTKNTSLRSITLDIDDDSYLEPFLQRLTYSAHSPTLERLNVPFLLSSSLSPSIDPTRIDRIMQNPYFSRLHEFRCRVCVIFGLEDVEGQPEGWYERPNDGSQPIKDMESRIQELRSKMPNLAERRVLQVDEYFRFASWQLWGRSTRRRTSSDSESGEGHQSESDSE